MLSTKTVNDLAERVLGSELVRVLHEADVEHAAPVSGVEVLTVDDLAKRYLTPQVIQAFPKVDFKAEEIGIGLEVKELHAYFRMRGLSLLIILLTLAALAIGADPVLALLRSLLGG
jgi:hypothetical protein